MESVARPAPPANPTRAEIDAARRAPAAGPGSLVDRFLAGERITSAEWQADLRAWGECFPPTDGPTEEERQWWASVTGGGWVGDEASPWDRTLGACETLWDRRNAEARVEGRLV